MMEKVELCEQAAVTNKKDITVLKDIVKLEKNVNAKKETIIKEKEAEVKQLREEAIERHSEHLVIVNDLKGRLVEMEGTKQ